MFRDFFTDMDIDDDMNIDLMSFIEEVKKRPVLWEPGLRRNVNRKQAAWFDIGSVMIKGFAEKSQWEKKEIVQKMYTRWKSLMDNYRSVENDWVKSGLPESKRHIGFYGKQLSFLQSVRGRETKVSILKKPEAVIGKPISLVDIKLKDRSKGIKTGNMINENTDNRSVGIKTQELTEGTKSKDGLVGDKTEDMVVIKEKGSVVVVKAENRAVRTKTKETAAGVKTENRAEGIKIKDMARSVPARSPTKPTSKFKQKKISSTTNIVNKADEQRSPDQYFFDSLLPTVKDFNDEQRFEFWSRVLEVVKSVSKQTSPSSTSNGEPQVPLGIQPPQQEMNTKCHEIPVNQSKPSLPSKSSVMSLSSYSAPCSTLGSFQNQDMVLMLSSPSVSSTQDCGFVSQNTNEKEDLYFII